MQSQLYDACIIGHLETVKFLVSTGTDITADNFVVKWASKKWPFGNSKIFGTRLSLGASIMADDNYAIKWAYSNDHEKQ
jgi:hypothetical protein